MRDKGFSEERVRKGCERLQKNLKTATQGRLDGFFKVTAPSPDKKRKAEEAAGGKGKKPTPAKSKAGGAGRGRPRK